MATSPLLFSENPADRRSHPRIPSTRLRVKRVRIQDRTPASLVDLSPGGALLELPFQIRPQTRFSLRIDTPVDIEVPFEVLRCYVADLKGGVTYHAAGAFDGVLNVDELARDGQGAMQRLIETLERLHRGLEKSTAQSDAEFGRVLCELVEALGRGESLDLVVLKLKAKLTQRYPSLVILSSPTTSSPASTSVSCFGLTFVSRYRLAAHDRRYLKANAQVLSLLEDTRCELRDEKAAMCSSPIVHSYADWIVGQPSFEDQLIAS